MSNVAVPDASSTPLDRLMALGGELTPPAAGVPRRKFELAHMHTLLAALGNPQRRFPAVLIAGTNGKGSTAATLASILQAAGHRVGLYTSPHLEQVYERIRIDGEMIPADTLAVLFLRVEAAATLLVASGSLPHTPSFFETITAIAFLHFAGDATASQALEGATPGGRPVEIAVLEVGLGGRLDATNVVEPLVSVITDISLDHALWLGDSIAAITREKAGILRAGGVLVTLPQHPEANQAIGEVAVPLQLEAVNAADYLPLRSHDASHATAGASLRAMLRNQYSLSLPAGPFVGQSLAVDSPLAGGHQQRNIALALATAVTLHQNNGFALSLQAMETGIRNTAWPGRLELRLPPAALHHHAPILLDAAHNPAGAWALRAALSPLPIDGPRTLVFGCMADKEIAELAQVLFPIFDEVLLTRADGPRAAPLASLVAAAIPTGALYRTFHSSADALSAAQAGTPGHGLVVLAGSIALLGEWMGQLHDWQ
ncbi:folylpolyglutamate synthase/dihydrofolate synthase family protein [Acidipila sp. EB88]|uniref:bifunctional folylpolyglutamate synthase/dihydrofolate synthase n=1 Tax=Acidipila sp. EB88 TaxID=2305226 RepID=UPI000F5D7FA1|nr:folylpolyglutamate synthase/dihydrofolate synthase family protein [Acidipila sp. EB88]RRA48197.1 bifunctional folylpolyglutamate synthase/dihydrofolate synthase [Acidipila sp. EB88]